MSWRKVLPAVGLVVACGVGGLNGDRPDMYGIEYDYVFGYHPDYAESIYGGSHYVVELGGREAINGSNSTTKIHPELKGAYVKYDPSVSRGESSWDVFASNWWPQSRNGLAWRWTVGESSQDAALSDHGKVDELSPVEKYDWLFNPGQKRTVKKVEHWDYAQILKKEEERGAKHSHPEVEALGPATEWELVNHGNYQGEYHPDSWWGHCNGWAAYVTTERLGAPKRDIKVKLVGGDLVECKYSTEGCVLVRMGDMEALMAEIYFNDQATFGGQRCEERPDEMERDEFGRPKNEACRDLNAGSFHITVTGLLGKGATHLQTGEAARPSFVIDHNYDYQVWNFPITKYEILSQEIVTKARASELVGAHNDKYQFNQAAVKFALVSMTYYMVSDSVSASAMIKQADDRNVALHPTTLHYVLEMDANDNIVGGEWVRSPSTQWGSDNSKELHPDFLWMATDARGYYENADDTGGWSDNPYIAKPNIDKLLKCANDPDTCAGDVAPTTPGTGSDTGSAGGDTGGDEPSTLSCDNSCGGSVTVGEQTCWCDDMCATYGDCCTDVATECPTTGGGTGGGSDTGSGGTGTGSGSTAATCAGHCGSTDPVPGSSPECYCDASCETYGDCCGDFDSTCDL